MALPKILRVLASAAPRLAVVAVGSIFLGGCDLLLDADRPGFWVSNQTDKVVDISYVEEGRERVLWHILDPTKHVPLHGVLRNENDCTHGDLVARDASGVEVARRTEPICNGEEWFVGVPSRSPR